MLLIFVYMSMSRDSLPFSFSTYTVSRLWRCESIVVGIHIATECFARIGGWNRLLEKRQDGTKSLRKLSSRESMIQYIRKFKTGEHNHKNIDRAGLLQASWLHCISRPTPPPPNQSSSFSQILLAHFRVKRKTKFLRHVLKNSFNFVGVLSRVG